MGIFRRYSPIRLFFLALLILLVLLASAGCDILLNLAEKAADENFKPTARKLYGTVAASNVSPITISSGIDGTMTETAFGAFELEYDQRYERWTGRSENVHLSLSGQATTPEGISYVYEGSGVTYGDVWLTIHDDGTYSVFFSTGQIPYTRTSSTRTVQRHDCSFELELMSASPSDGESYAGSGNFKDPDLKGTLGYEKGKTHMTWHFQPRPAEDSVKIFLLGEDGLQDITDQTTDILVGERVVLRAIPVITDPISDITDMAWEIGGLAEEIVIDNWIVQGNQPILHHVTGLDTLAIDYCWWDGTAGGQTQTVSHQLTLNNGDIVEGETTFNVFKPDVTLNATIGTIMIDRVVGIDRLELLLLGDGAGMKFEGQVALPDQFAGTGHEMQYVQRFQNDVYGLYQWSYPDMEWKKDSTDGAWWLDGYYPYPSDREGNIQKTQDTPGAPFATFTSIHLAMYFETFFMFKPDGDDNIWVPLKQVDWGWQAYASMSKHPGTDTAVIRNPDSYQLIRHQVIGPKITDAKNYPDWINIRPENKYAWKEMNPRVIVKTIDQWLPPEWQSPWPDLP